MVAAVVDREDDGQRLGDGVGGVACAQQNRDQCSLPVVAMNDIGAPEVLQAISMAAQTELAVTLGVVGIVAAAFAVETAAIEIVGIVDEEILDATEFAAVGDGREPAVSATMEIVMLGMETPAATVPR